MIQIEYLHLANLFLIAIYVDTLYCCNVMIATCFTVHHFSQGPAAFGLVSFLLHEGLDRTRIRKHLAIFSTSAPLLAIITYFGLSQVRNVLYVGLLASMEIVRSAVLSEQMHRLLVWKKVRVLSMFLSVLSSINPF